MKVALVALLVLPLAAAHVCLIYPIQRGAISGLDVVGSPDCFLVTAECGGRPSQIPNIVLWTGSNVSVIYQKNKNHFDSKTPGAFIVSMKTNVTSGLWSTLSTIKDSNAASLTLYETYITMPDVEIDHAIIQVVYKTNNPKAPPEFYQCSDVMVLKKK